MATVEMLMTREPVSCFANTPLSDVAAMMLRHDCGQIPVVDAEGKPLGVVTDRDIVTRLVATGRNPVQEAASVAMTSPARTVTADTSLKDCLAMMEEAQIRRVPVVDAQGRLQGMLAMADVALTGKQKISAELLKEVSAPAPMQNIRH